MQVYVGKKIIREANKIKERHPKILRYKFYPEKQCPIALRLQYQFPHFIFCVRRTEVLAAHKKVIAGRRHNRIAWDLPESVTRFIDRYDKDKEVDPFYLYIPKEVVNFFKKEIP